MVTEQQMRHKLNGFLGKICSKNYDSLSEALSLISKAVKATGFNAEELDGIYCGRKGRANDQIGKNTWLVIEWYKLSDHPHERWEVNSYAS